MLIISPGMVENSSLKIVESINNLECSKINSNKY